MERKIEEWPESVIIPGGSGYWSKRFSDHDRSQGVDYLVGKATDGSFWGIRCEPCDQYDPHTEFTITTDPTEAPADALLEGAGMYIEPGDKCCLGAGPYVAARFRSGLVSHLLAKHAHEWDPHSWDVKEPDAAADVHVQGPGRLIVHPRIAREFTKKLEAHWQTISPRLFAPSLIHKEETVMVVSPEALQDIEDDLAEDEPDCPSCNNTGRVAGAFMAAGWPCHDCHRGGAM